MFLETSFSREPTLLWYTKYNFTREGCNKVFKYETRNVHCCIYYEILLIVL